MPKLSVSVPDDLWERAVNVLADEKRSASRVVQDALADAVSARERSSFAADEIGLGDQLRATAEQLSDSVRGEFARGYEVGLQICAAIGADGVASIIAWGEGHVVWVFDVEDDNPVILALGQEPEFVAGDEERWAIFHEGADQAVRDVWDALRDQNISIAPSKAAHKRHAPRPEAG